MKYFLWMSEQQQGPYDTDEIAKMLKDGTAAPDTLCRPEGTQEWNPIRTHLTLPVKAGFTQKTAPPPVAKPVPSLNLTDAPIATSAIAGVLRARGIGAGCDNRTVTRCHDGHGHDSIPYNFGRNRRRLSASRLCASN
jgi:hypothetical protein